MSEYGGVLSGTWSFWSVSDIAVQEYADEEQVEGVVCRCRSSQSLEVVTVLPKGDLKDHLIVGRREKPSFIPENPAELVRYGLDTCQAARRNASCE